MKNVCLLISLAVFAAFMFQSCSKDNEILPNANAVLTDEGSTIDEVNMVGGVAGVNKGELMVITGKKLVGESEKKVIIYIKGNSDGSYPVDISANSLLSFNLETINSSTVIYYVSNEEYYLLVKGEITIANTEQKMMPGTFSGKVIPAYGLTGLPLETILTLYDGNKAIEGDFKTYSIKF